MIELSNVVNSNLTLAVIQNLAVVQKPTSGIQSMNIIIIVIIIVIIILIIATIFNSKK